MDDAIAACEYVLSDLMPLMDPKNVLNSVEMLLPIIRVYMPRGEYLKLRKLFDKYAIQNFHKHFGKDGVTPAKPLFKPLMSLFDISHDPEGFPDLEDIVEWLGEPEKSVTPDFVEWALAPPNSSEVTSSFVTVLTTFGPVTNM